MPSPVVLLKFTHFACQLRCMCIDIYIIVYITYMHTTEADCLPELLIYSSLGGVMPYTTRVVVFYSIEFVIELDIFALPEVHF